ncbi:MAG: ribonucleotide-diphosphate reductase subunit beta [Helicobacteraceae bacterium]|nr:ribonucleotide-diphosphate reductase subunit beta [Helicobacteraceae bacterium]
MSLLSASRVFKPMKYPEAFEHWNTHDKMVWHWDEVPLGDDVKDFSKADTKEKEFITQVMRLFTQNDIEVGHGYDVLLRIFKPTEVSMMLRGNADRESTHIASYSLFTETLGFEDSFYSEFLEDKNMADKIEFVKDSQVLKYEQYAEMGYSEEEIAYRYKQDIMFMIAVYAVLTEGVSLFAQFAMLLKYQIDGKYKGLGTIVEWSIKDEEQHVVSNAWLLKTFIKENSEVFNDEIKKRIYKATRTLVEKECELVDELNPPHMDNEEVKQYIKYIADQRLKLIGFKANYNINKSPFPWMDELTGTVLTNFFEGKSTEYTMNSLTGDWNDI